MTKPAKKAAEKPRPKADVVDGSYSDVPPATNALPEPSAHRRASIAHSQARMEKRRARVSLALPDGPGGGALGIQSPHADQNGWAAQLNDAFGTSSADFAGHMLTMVANLSAKRGQQVTQEDLNAGLAFVDGIEPQNEVEASLAVTMYGANELAADLMLRARTTERMDSLNTFINAATKLHRTAIASAEALAKLRRGGEQTVRVVYVDARTQTVIKEQNNYEAGSVASIDAGSSLPIDLAAIPIAAPGKVAA